MATEILEIVHPGQECIAQRLERGPINHDEAESIERGFALGATGKRIAPHMAQSIANDCLARIALATMEQPELRRAAQTLMVGNECLDRAGSIAALNGRKDVLCSQTKGGTTSRNGPSIKEPLIEI